LASLEVDHYSSPQLPLKCLTFETSHLLGICNGLSLGWVWFSYRQIFVYNICLIRMSDTVSDGATKTLVLNIETA